MGYIMGKAEGKGKNWHGHVTALTVAPEFRRIGLGEPLAHPLSPLHLPPRRSPASTPNSQLSTTPHGGHDELGEGNNLGNSILRTTEPWISTPAHHMMNELEEISEKKHNGYFVDLFVRKSNTLAINMYTKFGYSVFR
jgi:GNAT superfamily N-acetyltransferase